MRTLGSILAMAAVGLTLGGCSTTKLLDSMGGAKSETPATVQYGNNLAMPPDLQLRAPTTVTENYQPNAVGTPAIDAASLEDNGNVTTPDTSAATGSTAVAAAPAPAMPAKPRDVYAEYGISKTKPDGTAKNAQELEKELKVAVTKRKQLQNPNYGTIFNMRNVFKDG